MAKLKYYKNNTLGHPRAGCERIASARSQKEASPDAKWASQGAIWKAIFGPTGIRRGAPIMFHIESTSNEKNEGQEGVQEKT